MPDRNDPKYRERYERDVAAGGRFARATGLTWLGRRVVLFATGHKVLFLVLVFGFTVFVFFLQTWRFVRVLNGGGHSVPVTELVDSALQDRFQNTNQMMNDYEEED